MFDLTMISCGDRLGPRGRLHRTQITARIWAAIYDELSHDLHFQRAVHDLFAEVRGAVNTRRHSRVAKSLPPLSNSMELVVARTELVRRTPKRLRLWPWLPFNTPDFGRDLEFSWDLWVRGRSRRPRLMVGRRWFAGLPEHEDQPAATDAEARALGYEVRMPTARTDKAAYTRIAERLCARAKGRRWSEIALEEAARRSVKEHSPSAKTIKRVTTAWASRLQIPLPPLPPGRPPVDG